MRHGIRGLIIDPWNEIEHAKEKFENETAYINRALRQIIKFGRRHGLATFVLAHPTKDVGKDGKPRVPTLYDIEGSAAWFNKPDFGIVVHRPDPTSTAPRSTSKRYASRTPATAHGHAAVQPRQQPVRIAQHRGRPQPTGVSGMSVYQEPKTGWLQNPGYAECEEYVDHRGYHIAMVEEFSYGAYPTR